MKTISVKEALENQNTIVIDVRSPSEFEDDHFPNSINIPVLDDEERRIVGTLYKDNPDKAIELGYDYYHKKMPELTKKLTHLGENKKIAIMCFRGGMRSATIVKLAQNIGLDAVQLEGGYKNYRKYIREWFESYEPQFKFIVLQGLAGCGKTALLKELLNNHEPILDLEGLAQHRSSVFGAIGLKPRTQKTFETLMYIELMKFKNTAQKLVFVEGESHKVGSVFIPNSVFNAMKKGIVIKINSSMDTRVKQIVNDYFTHNEDKKIKKIIDSLKKNLSKELLNKIQTAMDEQNYDLVSKLLLEEYYDPRYKFIVDTIEYEHEVDNENIKSCTEKLIRIKKKIN